MNVDLEHADEVIDPRHYGVEEEDEDEMYRYTFRFSVKGRTLTITRTDGYEGWNCGFRLRAYLSSEEIPDFTSTVYTYHALDREEAPRDTTKVIFHPSVTTIQADAFFCCYALERVTIPDTVTRIENYAFNRCESLRFIRLSVNLEFIGWAAFNGCESLEAVFLPPTVTHIGDYAFRDCTSLRFFHVPESIDHLGNDIFYGCDQLVSTTVSNNLSKVCYSTSVDPQSIQECIHTHGIELTTEVDDEEMLALHILCANPHVTEDCIRTYLQLAPEAANQEDSEGMTAFQYLCRNDVNVLEDMSFSSLMIWWYHCMPPQTETGTKRKRE